MRVSRENNGPNNLRDARGAVLMEQYRKLYDPEALRGSLCELGFETPLRTSQYTCSEGVAFGTTHATPATLVPTRSLSHRGLHSGR